MGGAGDWVMCLWWDIWEGDEKKSHATQQRLIVSFEQDILGTTNSLVPLD